jgi:hypothetical protein
MLTFARRMGVAVVASLAAVGFAASAAWGQGGVRMGSGLTATQLANQPFPGVPGYAQGYSAPAPFAGLPAASLYSTPGAGYAASLTSTGGAGNGSGSGYYPPYGYYESAYGGFLRGNADVISASGQYLINYERAKLGREAVRQARIDTRRKMFDEYLYERANTPTLEDERERAIELERRRSVNDPPVTEIWSAKALNDLLFDVQKLQGKGISGPRVGLDEDTLKRINVSAGKTAGNVGLLKNDGKLSWPLALRTMRPQKEADSLRQDVDSELPGAINEAVNGKVSSNRLEALTKDVDKLQQLLTNNVRDLPPGQYMEARRFLNNLEDGLQVLQQPNAGLYFTHQYAAKGKTVHDLVNNMTKEGLTFAPAVGGDEAAYVALHRALAAYDVAARGQSLAENK